MEKTLDLTETRVHKFLFAVQGVGIVFAAVFLAAYLGGLPSTNVLHSEPIFRLSLTVLGVALLVLILAAIILAVYVKSRK